MLGEEQNGFRRGRSGMENVYVMKEIIERSKRNGSKLYMTFLDIEKAYDGINRENLMKLLQHIGTDEKIINILKDMYKDNKMKFRLGEIETEWMDNNSGVRQGCMVSPTLFNIYIEELFVRIRKLGVGAKIGNERIGSLGYADDIVLMAESEEDMDRLLKIVEEYGEEWDVNFSRKKSKVMEFNTSGKGQWVLGNAVLEVVQRYCYLGMEISKEGIGGDLQRKANEGKARKMMGMIINGGSREINKYEYGRCLWKGMGVPKFMYGTELTNYRIQDVRKLDTIQNSIGRWCLGAPKCTAIEAIRGEMGWSTCKERIIKSKLYFAKKIERMRETRITRRVYEESKRKSQWCKDIERWKNKLQIQEGWTELTTREINKKIEELGYREWREGIERKSTLTWYGGKTEIRKEDWYCGDWESKLLFKTRSGTLEVNGRNREIQEQGCKLCGEEKETIEHLIVECDSYSEERRALDKKIQCLLGDGEWSRRREESDRGIRTVLGLTNNHHDKTAVTHMKKFLKSVWMKRKKVLEENK